MLLIGANHLYAIDAKQFVEIHSVKVQLNEWFDYYMLSLCDKNDYKYQFNVLLTFYGEFYLA